MHTGIAGFIFDPRETSLCRGFWSINILISVDELCLAKIRQLSITVLVVNSYEIWKSWGQPQCFYFVLMQCDCACDEPSHKCEECVASPFLGTGDQER